MSKMTDFELAECLEALSNHPFTLIGLADREKFHTGMLAHSINALDSELRGELIKRLWGSVANPEDRRAFVEVSSVDLLLKPIQNADLGPLWAEIKCKTTLASHQLAKYQAKHPHGQGALLQLFSEEAQGDGITRCAFPREIVGFFEECGSEWLHDDGQSVDDTKALVRLWVSYLRELASVVSHFQAVDLGAVSLNVADVERSLQNVKLKGIFQHHRFSLVAKWLAKHDTRGASWALFNSHGNAGIDIVWNAPSASDISTHLQWQASSLKLAVSSQTKDDPRKIDRIRRLQRTFIGRDSMQHEGAISKGKFQSITVEKWDILEAITDERFAVLQAWIEHIGSQMTGSTNYMDRNE